jgi:phosphomannomutase
VEKKNIISSLRIASELLGFVPVKTWGEVIEDRGSQITFSALGQDAPLQEKKVWDPDFSKRKQMQVILSKSLPDFSVRLGGTTSIDVTRIGIDKAYGISKLTEILGIGKEKMLFVGDAIFPGGNDYAVKEAGVDSIEVRDSTESKRVIQAIIACLN